MTSVELPDFITIAFLQSIFEQNFGGNGHLKVENYWGEFATKKGENYASTMYRISVDYELNDVKRRKPIILKVHTHTAEIRQQYFCFVFKFLIITRASVDTDSLFLFSFKAMPSGELQSVVMEKNRLYPREIHAYCDLLVEIEQLVRDNLNFVWYTYYLFTC